MTLVLLGCTVSRNGVSNTNAFYYDTSACTGLYYDTTGCTTELQRDSIAVQYLFGSFRM